MLVRQVEQKVAKDVWSFGSFCLLKVCSMLNVSSDLKSFMQISEAATFWTHGMNWTDFLTEEMAELKKYIRSCARFEFLPCTSVCPQSRVADAGASFPVTGWNRVSAGMCTCKLYTILKICVCTQGVKDALSPNSYCLHTFRCLHKNPRGGSELLKTKIIQLHCSIFYCYNFLFCKP